MIDEYGNKIHPNYGSSDDDWAIVCKGCGHVSEEHAEGDDYEPDRPCDKKGCDCRDFKTKTDENNNVVYDKRLD